MLSFESKFNCNDTFDTLKIMSCSITYISLKNLTISQFVMEITCLLELPSMKHFDVQSYEKGLLQSKRNFQHLKHVNVKTL